MYGISRESLRRIMEDAKEQDMPIKTTVLKFRNGSMDYPQTPVRQDPEEEPGSVLGSQPRRN